jgi:hypothetical protein
VLPSIKERGEYICIDPEDKGRYYFCKKVVAFKSIKTIFGLEPIPVDRERFLSDNGVPFEEIEGMPEDKLVLIQGYKIPVALFKKATLNDYIGFTLGNTIVGSIKYECGKVSIKIFSNEEVRNISSLEVVIGDEKISYNQFAYRFEDNKFVLEPSLDVVINKLHQDLGKKLSKSEMVLAEKYATQRWQDAIDYQKKVIDRFALAEEQIKELPEKIYTVTNIEYSIGREMRHTPWGSAPVEYYILKEAKVEEGKKENDIKVCNNLYISKNLIEKIMEEVSDRDIYLQSKDTLIDFINNTFCVRVMVKDPYNNEGVLWEEWYYYNNNQKPNLPDDGISFWRWARKEEI